MAGLPSMPLFFGDLLASTATWEGEERALYVVLLAYQWVSGPLPTEPKRIARMCQYDPANFLALWKTVGKKFIETADGLVNERLEQHRERAKDISEKRAAAGAKSVEVRKQKRVASSSNTEAIAPGLHIHPIQSNPIQSKSEEKILSPVPHEGQKGPEGIVSRGTFDGWQFVEQRMRPNYPVGIYAPTIWQNVARTVERLHLEQGVKLEDIEAGCRRFNAYAIAKGSVGTEFVVNPERWLTEQRYTLAYAIGGSPVTESPERARMRETEAREWQGLHARAKAVGFREPAEGESQGAYRTLLQRCEDAARDRLKRRGAA